MILLAQPETDDVGVDTRRIVDVHPIEYRRIYRVRRERTRSWLVSVRRADGTVNEGRIYARSATTAKRAMVRNEIAKGLRVTRIVKVVPC